MQNNRLHFLGLSLFNVVTFPVSLKYIYFTYHDMYAQALNRVPAKSEIFFENNRAKSENRII